MRPARRPFATRVLRTTSAALLALGLASTSRALTWNNLAGGSAATPTNWTPNAVPGPTDLNLYDLAATYSVTIPTASIPLTREHIVRDGVVSFSVSGATHALSGSLRVGDFGSARVNLTSGSMSAIGLSIGSSAGSYGRLTIGPTTALASPPVVQLSGTPLSATIGNAGTGRLDVLGGSSLQMTGELLAGANTNARCTLSVSGRSSLFSTSSSIVSTAAGARLGASSANVYTFVDNGGFMRFAGPVTLASTGVRTTSLRVGTGVGTTPPSFLAQAGLHIGDNAAAGATSGFANLQVARGLVSVGGPATLGDPDGFGTATAQISGGEWRIGGGLNRQPGSTWIHTGGLVNFVSGAVAWPSTEPLVVSSSLGAPQVRFGNLLQTTFTGGIRVGGSGAGTLVTANAGTRVAVPGAFTVGDSAGSNGVVVVDSSSVLHVTGSTVLGRNGVSDVTVRGGAHLAAEGGADLAVASGSTSFVTLREGGYLSALGMRVGGALPAIGQALVSVDDNGALDVSGALDIRTSTGNMRVGSGGFVITNTLQVDGVLELQGGDVFATDGMTLGAPGLLLGTGRVDGAAVLRGTTDLVDSVATFGRLVVVGRVRLEATHSLRLHIGGTASPRNDALAVANDSLVLGGLLSISPLPGFVPAPLDTFVLLEGGVVTGQFDEVQYDGEPLPPELQLVVLADRVLLVASANVGAPEAAGTPQDLRLSVAGRALALALPLAADIELAVFDVSGRRVCELRRGPLAAGVHRIELPEATVATGVYFVRADVRRPQGMEWRVVKWVRRR